MSLLAPLGLLGLLGIIALIIIYIIKPNYQNKFISSTFIWKLSLKYKKKKIPINKLRNIILFICQIAIITGAALILAKPFIDTAIEQESADVILIIDASASMQTQVNQETRLERAANAALEDAKKAFESGKRVSLIIASEKASYLAREAGKDQADTVYSAIDDIINTPADLYTFGTPDIDGAIALAEEITAYKEDAAVTLYTDTSYLGTGKITVNNIVDTAEWNAAILDVRATLIDGNYRIEIDVASYGKESNLEVVCEVLSPNGEDGTIKELVANAYCSNDEVTTLVFAVKTEEMSEAEADLITEEVSINRFEQLYVYVDEYDSLSYDNQFYLYGGKRPVIKVKYCSTLHNNFWLTALEVLADGLKSELVLEIDKNYNTVMTEGFDLYIFEHGAPKTIPTDGVVIFSDPSSLPGDLGIRFGDGIEASGELFFSAMEEHEVMKNINAGNISVTQFSSVVSYDEYTPIMGYNNYPLVLVKNEVDQKVVVMPFSIHYSNLAVVPEFPILLRNLVKYYFPLTVDEYVFEPGETVKLNARSNILTVMGPETNLTFEEFPTEVTLQYPGTYTMMQYLMSGDPAIEYVFVKIPSIESNINHTEDTLTNPYFFQKTEQTIIDLLFYFALAVVALLFIEWFLKSREQI